MSYPRYPNAAEKTILTQSGWPITFTNESDFIVNMCKSVKNANRLFITYQNTFAFFMDQPIPYNAITHDIRLKKLEKKDQMEQHATATPAETRELTDIKNLQQYLIQKVKELTEIVLRMDQNESLKRTHTEANPLNKTIQFDEDDFDDDFCDAPEFRKRAKKIL